MTADHIFPLLESEHDSRLLCQAAWFRLGRLTAVRKPDGGAGASLWVFNILRRELWTHARIQIHLGRPKSGTKVEGNYQVGTH